MTESSLFPELFLLNRLLMLFVGIFV